MAKSCKTPVGRNETTISIKFHVMKKFKLLLIGSLSLAGFMLAGCENKIKLIDPPVYNQDVLSVTFISEVKGGVSIYEGESLSLAAKVTVVPSTATDYTMSFDSSDKTVATVSENGLLSAKAVGTAKITVTAEGKSDNFMLTVMPVIPVTAVTFDEELAEGLDIIVGETLELADRFTFSPDNTTYPVVTYTSSNETVATIDETGKVTTVGGGETTITVTVSVTVAGVLIAEESDSFKLIVIGVNSITWDAVLKSDGLLLVGIGTTANVADRMTVDPEVASIRPKTYISSDETVATINAEGLITAVSNGTATITVSADKGSDSFTLTVYRGILESVALDYPEGTKMIVPVGATNRIWGHVNVTPVPADLKNKWVNFSSSDTSVATVDKYGVIIGIAPGTATITVFADNDQAIAATLEVEVAAATYYARNTTEGAATPWSMTFSHALSGTGNGNGPLAALDGVYKDDNVDAGTVLIMTRPGKNSGGVNLTGSTDPIWFTVDMKEPQVVNVFKLIFRSGPNTNIGTRYYGFDKIEGSNDGIDFTPIATMVEVADALSPLKLAISETTFENETAYQYYKFTAQTVGFCFINGMANYPGVSKLLNADRTPSSDWNSGNINNRANNDGNTAQIQEIYLGKIQ